MNRRDSLKLMALAVSGSAWPAFANVGAPHVAIYDGRFAEGRKFARKAGRAYDCQVDAAGLWFRQFSGRKARSGNISGLTSPADAMVLADCARREGLTFTPLGQQNGLVSWRIAGKI